jgi:cell surface protein SprA
LYKAFKYIFLGAISLALLSVVFLTSAKVGPAREFGAPAGPVVLTPDTPVVALPYPYQDQSGKDPMYFNNNKGLKLHDPSNIKTTVVYDPDSNQFQINQKMGDLQYREPTYMTYDEYVDYSMRKSLKDYWKQRVHAESLNQKSQRSNIIPPIKINNIFFDRIFGGNTVDIRPQGSAELIFGANINRTENPALPVKQRRITTFDFNEKIQLNVVGKIGDKLKLTTNYNTEATFDFENQMKLEYTGYEDEIIKKIEAGNVSLPLNSSLITGSQTLFGVKAQLQFGRLTATTVFSQEKGKKSEVNVTGGAQITNFEVTGDNYDANKHFFLSTYFRDQYNSALANLPIVNSLVNITRIEVWVTNKTSTTDNTRNILALTDLGETRLHQPNKSFVTLNQPAGTNPANNANSLYFKLANQAYPLPPLNSGNTLRNINNITNTLASLGCTGPTCPNFQPVSDFEKVQFSKKLAQTEYTVNKRLGFISLNAALNYDEVLAVAYQYTIGNSIYQVGEFSDDGISGDNVLFVKMLKSTNVSPRADTLLWNLMMKNIYSIGAYQVNQQDFRCDVIYNNPATSTDIRYIPEGPISGKPLIQVLNADRLNANLDPIPDGIYDFIDGVTIDAAKGRIMLPVVEPFGDYLASKLYDPADPTLAGVAGNLSNPGKYPFYDLYDSTRTAAQQNQKKNRFKLKGQYKGAASNDISLNAVNVPQGSVMVTSGGVPLTENVDYTVDYALGRVKIINEGLLQSGAPIKISLESNSLFNIQTKSLIGTHLDFRFNKDFTIGGTVLNLTERPLTQKVNIGDEPINNTMVGLNANYRTETPWLTRLVDKIPLIQTKEMSNITSSGEWAALIPGYNKAIGAGGTSYIDDFEGTQSAIDLKQPSAWSISSIPNDPSLFPETSILDSVAVGYNRARLCWYTIDPLFIRQGNSITPPNISKTDMSNHFVKEAYEDDLFPNKESPTGQPIPISVLDLAYYPNERGPYNYDVMPDPHAHSAGLNANGTLAKPWTRWGGIMRQIQTNDFEAANIQFIQFWMMDPFDHDGVDASDNLNPNTTGDLYFDLGSISEDILRDSRKEYENGIVIDPSSGAASGYDQTIWGRVPNAQVVVNAFGNDNTTRIAQDAGYDGMLNADERVFFANTYLARVNAAFPAGSGARDSANYDPSADDYHYYRGTDYDNQSIGILGRYKKFNGPEGNSIPSGVQNQWGYTESYSTQATTLPNTEDVNHDNTLNETEAYYEYRVKLTANDIKETNVGRNFITDYHQSTKTTIDGRLRTVDWYQFRIPITEYSKKVGTIDDFKSIRFLRIFFKNVDQPVICRMAKLELVRDEWRRYNYSLISPGEYIPNDDVNTSFNLAAVSIEENGSRKPVNYVLPPGIQRQQSAATANIIKLNEQSLSLKVCGLKDGDARAAYKTMTMDVRSYKTIRMFIHAEAGPDGSPLNNNDLECFVRMGTDFTDNYYEYVIPLQVTLPGAYGQDDPSLYKVWPAANEMVLSFSELQQAKQERNTLIATGRASLTTEQHFAASGNRSIIIKGNPNLAALKTMMIGVRNPKKFAGGPADDGQSKCAEVWVDELRLTDFDETGGWAAVGRMTAKLADFGTVTVAGNYSTPGFGGIESKVSTRQKETDKSIDISSQLELGKFFPSKLSMRIPMYVGFSESIATPQYNPLDPDILVKNLSPTVQDQIRHEIETFSRRRSINFTNVKKERSKGVTKKPRFYDPENIALNFAYSEMLNRSPTIDHNFLKNYRGGLTYNFNTQPKNVKPFSKNAFLNKYKYLALIRDMNFNTSITSVSFLTDINRSYSESLNRNTTGVSDIPLTPTYNKTFNMTRNYDVKYDLTKALKIDFSAINESRVLEPEGPIDTQQKRDTILNNMLGLGKNTHYHHTLNFNYAIPINKIPALDFTTATVRYATSYDWLRAPFSADSMGNTIQNSQQWTWNGQANMVTLYNKVPYFKKINGKKPPGQIPKPVTAPAVLTKPKVVLKPTTPAELAAKTKADSIAKVKSDSLKKKDSPIFEYVARAIMTIKTISVNYTDTRGTILPGYNKQTSILGMDNNFQGPGLGFLVGEQDHFGGNQAHYGIYAAQHDWLVETHSLYNPFARTRVRNLNGRANLEPFPDCKVELNANLNRANNNNEYFRWNPIVHDYTSETPSESGNISMSYSMLRTTLISDNKDHTSPVFEQFRNNRAVMSSRLGLARDPHAQPLPATGYYDGYSSASQDVLIPAFLAAYSGKNSSTFSLDPFKVIPKPNWRVTYDGLSKNEKFKKYFKSFTLSHAYRSNYSIGNFASNLDFLDASGSGFGTVKNPALDYISKYNIPAVTLSEQFSPLINADMTWHSGLLTKVEIKKDRTVSLSVTSNQVTELNGKELVIGLGYAFKLKPRKLFPQYLKEPVKSDLKVRCDVSVRNNQTVIRKIDPEYNQLTSGQNLISVKTSADYILSSKLSIRLFCDYIRTNPLVSTSFLTSNTNIGISLRLTL